MQSNKTTEQFIAEAKLVHQDTYDYSTVIYVNAHTKIAIGCSQHGIFWQAPTAHLHRKAGCPQCAGHLPKVTESFITAAIAKHGLTYDYTATSYINDNTKVAIICKTHGMFWQSPNAHLQGKGCNRCAYTGRTNTTKQFISKARLKHGNKYDYSKVVYTKSYEQIVIICHQHGEFTQRACGHLNGNGCPQCAKEIRTIKTAELVTQGILSPPQYNYRHGWHISNKTGEIYYRSSYELAYYHILDKDCDVITYKAEPLHIKYEYNGQIRCYIPDLLVTRLYNQELLEIKPKKLVLKPINQAKFVAARNYCKTHNMPFIIITEDDLLTPAS